MICSTCGLPRGIGKANLWEQGGIIVSKYSHDTRGILCDVDELKHMVDSLSARIGYDITPLIIEGKRQDAKLYAQKMLEHLVASGIEPPAPEDFMRGMSANYSIPGFGRMEMIDYFKGKSVTLKAEDIYNVPMCMGQAAGIFEAVLGRHGEVAWEGDEHNGLLHLTVGEDESERTRRMESVVEAESSVIEENEADLEHCPECRAPRDLSRDFIWDIERARIEEKRTAKRFIFDNSAGINAVVRVLREELGDEVEQLLTDIAREYAVEYYTPLRKASSMREEFSLYALAGWGAMEELRESAEGYTLRLVNSYYPSILAGRTWGLMEVFSDRELGMRSQAGAGGAVELFLNS